VTLQWLAEPVSWLGASVQPDKWHWRGNCYNACLDACIAERGADVPPFTDICAADCYDKSGCAKLAYGTQQEYLAQTSHVGVFDQGEVACRAHQPNSDVCGYICDAARLGWGDSEFETCKRICISGACTQGFLITPSAMQKVMAGSGACLTKCYADAAKLADPTARAAANAACPSTCALAAELAKLPPKDKPSTRACPDGHILIDGACRTVCPGGQTWVDGACRPTPVKKVATPTRSAAAAAGIVALGILAAFLAAGIAYSDRGEET